MIYRHISPIQAKFSIRNGELHKKRQKRLVGVYVLIIVIQFMHEPCALQLEVALSDHIRGNQGILPRQWNTNLF